MCGYLKEQIKAGEKPWSEISTSHEVCMCLRTCPSPKVTCTAGGASLAELVLLEHAMVADSDSWREVCGVWVPIGVLACREHLSKPTVEPTIAPTIATKARDSRAEDSKHVQNA